MRIKFYIFIKQISLYLLLNILCINNSLLYSQCAIVSKLAGTIVDTGGSSYAGDGGIATSGVFNASDGGFAFDTIGNIYWADTYNNRIRKISRTGIVSTFAGTGTNGFSGDGGPATSANLSIPNSVAVDLYGNVYISDFGNNRIRKVNSSGEITTYAGGGTYFTSDTARLATTCILTGTRQIVIDRSGRLYFISGYNIIKIDERRMMTVFAGNGTPGFSRDGASLVDSSIYPACINIDRYDNLYIVDRGSTASDHYIKDTRIRKITPSGSFTTIAGNGTEFYSSGVLGTSVKFDDDPSSIAIDKFGNVFFPSAHEGYLKLDSRGRLFNIEDAFKWNFEDSLFAARYGVSLNRVYSFHTLIDRENNHICNYNGRGLVRINFNALSLGPIVGPSTVNTFSTITLSDTAVGGTWASSNTARATINASGVVYGFAPGEVVISYTLSNACGTSQVSKTINLAAPIHAPNFIVGVPTSTTTCMNLPKIISDNIRVSDMDSGQTLSWSLYRAPRFGIVNATFTATSNRGIIRPASDRIYTPNTGYLGRDTFIVRVTDGIYNAYQTIYITVNPLPTTPTIYGDTTLCRSASTVLTSTPIGGSWTRNTSNFSVSTAGVVTSITSGSVGFTDYVTYFSAANIYGCKSSARHYISVPSMPASISIAGSSVGTVGGSANYTSAISGGSWSVRDSGIASINMEGVANFLSAGTTIINYTVNRCGRTYSTSRTIIVPASKHEGLIKSVQDKFQGVAIYPNPTSGLLNIDLPFVEAKIILYDINGKLVLSKESNALNQQLDIRDYPKGVYIIAVENGNNKSIYKVILD